MKSTVSENGQVTIPKSIRDRLGLTPGVEVDFEVDEGVLVGRKVPPEDVFRKWRGRGRLPVGADVDEYLDSARGGRANGR